MKNLAKSAATAILAMATLATAVPASAQIWGNGPRGDYRYNDRYDNGRDGRWNDNDRRDGRHWNDNRRWRQHCWTEKRWDPYRHKRVKVRLCSRY